MSSPGLPCSPIVHCSPLAPTWCCDKPHALVIIGKYLRLYHGVIRASLAYAMRKTINVQTYCDFPKYVTSDDEMICQYVTLASRSFKHMWSCHCCLHGTVSHQLLFVTFLRRWSNGCYIRSSKMLLVSWNSWSHMSPDKTLPYKSSKILTKGMAISYNGLEHQSTNGKIS